MKRADCFAKGDIEIVLANFAMHSDGNSRCAGRKDREMVTRACNYNERALRALPGKSARRAHFDMRWGFHDPTRTPRSRSRAPEEESLWSNAIRLRPATGD